MRARGGVGSGSWGGVGLVEVADDAGGFPGVVEPGTGFGPAEAEDELTHPRVVVADFAEFGEQGCGKRFASAFLSSPSCSWPGQSRRGAICQPSATRCSLSQSLLSRLAATKCMLIWWGF